MATLDYNKYDVIGIVNRMGASQNAQIIGAGLSDRETGVFIPVQAEDRNAVFPTRGCVFAFDFLKHHPDWENECICLCVKPNNNPNIINGEDYVWDWKDEPYIYADRLKKLNTHIGEDGGENHNKLFYENLLPCEDVIYFICGDKIYRLACEIRLVPFWKLSKVSSSLITYKDSTYLLEDINVPEDGKIDITSDNQLIEWYKKNILKKEGNTIYEAKDFKSVDAVATAELQRLKIPTNIYQNRLARIMELSSNVSLTFEELEDLSSAPWFKDLVQKTMDENAERYLEKLKKDHAAEISRLKSNHEQELSALDNKVKQDKESLQHQIEEKKEELTRITLNNKKEESELKKTVLKLQEELDSISNEIENKNKIIEELNSRKESIIADFSVVKEVLSTSSSNDSSTGKQTITVTDFNMNNEREFPTAGPFRKNIESLLMKSNGMKVSTDEIVTKLSLHNIVLFPDNKTLLATMQATRRCRYVVSYVGVDWKSFNNLWESGLLAITTEAIRNPDIIHFLVLRNINMSFIPCYLQPILDMESGLTKYFPGTELEFPENMRILCTRVKETVIPVTESSLTGIGCISTCEERHTGKGNIAEGYLPVSVFSDLPIDEQYNEKNFYDSYTDDE